MKVQNIKQYLQDSKEIVDSMDLSKFFGGESLENRFDSLTEDEIETLEQMLDEKKAEGEGESDDEEASVTDENAEDMREASDNDESDSKEQSTYPLAHDEKSDEERLEEIGEKAVPAPKYADITLLINERTAEIFSQLNITKCSKNHMEFYFNEADKAIVHIKDIEQDNLTDNIGYVVEVEFEDEDKMTFISGVKDNPVEAYQCLIEKATDSTQFRF